MKSNVSLPHCADDPIPTRKSLLGRLRNWEDNESWRLFFETYWRLIYRFASQRGLSHQEAEDVVQDTVLAVAKGIGRFEYDPERCAFKTWLLTVTRSKIAHQFEKRARDNARCAILEEDSATAMLGPIPDAPRDRQWEQIWEDEWRQNLIESAIERVKQRVQIEHFQMFDLFALKGWTAREVAKTLRVSVAHVYVAKHRIMKLVQKHYTMLEANSGCELTEKSSGV
jgi:RNA polymerase sigma factor (sigma-70 family)